MSARDHSAGREVIHSADDCLHEGCKVEIFLRARQEPIAVARLNPGQFTVRIFSASGASYDVAYSAIEAARYVRHSPINAVSS
ncbi:hypothetical protein [Sphingomonas sp. R1]|uniref:hypothetical protein n=1 Tax=Sphingomonas sp. R1 TaxID=399176 RepID=UPI0022247AA6|nr:hypothetical protein [Sphingomonas sp. R1]UYY78067.1 hypothetical protein OIM94_03395 [Sphingomonas sp. R1]